MTLKYCGERSFEEAMEIVATARVRGNTTTQEVREPEKKEEIIPLHPSEARFRFFRNLDVPDLFFSRTNFPAVELKDTQVERANALKKFLTAKGPFRRKHRAESEVCLEKVQKVLDSFLKANLGYVNLTEGQSPELHRLISAICDVSWLADKITVAPRHTETPVDADNSRGGLAEIFPVLVGETNFLALTARTCKYKGWKFDSAGGTVTAAYLAAYIPYICLHAVVIQITLTETGPPTFELIFSDYLRYATPEIFKLHKLLFWVANENGGHLLVQQTLNPRLIYDEEDDLFFD
eukprot:Gregarina_sp_Pseudo_9__1533@NODE_2029_length_1194_cov_101_038961_g1874_i0_p1_GENE_NODE_2029_length_1194_cov_101_038961_g1874_i0NODE_2029_length_1194_cov_101_038961_g1874_i0_p1_ORF_typecomplete_len343_score24_90Sec2p/PF06428_11/0_46Sec2p/PF06428_11/6_2e03_NODE_2029_length_1194_cov_101_038961_g1874_i01661044